jgi:uncharacterized protein (TIGR04255 family)
MMAELPTYEHPPVNEVVLAVAFVDPPGLTSAHLGHFWFAELRPELPELEEQPPYLPPVESLGPPSPVPLSLQLFGQPPSTRLWARSSDGTRLVQLQRGWIAFNWRDAPGSTAPYPRWPQIEELFLKYFRQFRAFLEREGLGEIAATQCEVTYINNIKSGSVWADHGDLHEVISLLNKPSGSLGRAETTQFATAFRMSDNEAVERGRLHVTAQPAFQVADNAPVLVLTLVARGAPYTPGEDGVLSFLRLGHEWVVEGFTAVTTNAMHHEWGRLA